MKDLIERLEKATGPDRELGNAILFACGWVTNEYGLGPSRSTEWVNPDPSGIDYLDGDQPNPTASIDAALMIVPDNYATDVCRYTTGLGDARIWKDERSKPEAGFSTWTFSRNRPASPAIALCIAALKARIS